MPAVRVYGEPVPKGSLSGYSRGGRVVMVEKVKDKGKWREKVRAAGAALLATLDGPYTGPVIVHSTVTLARPKSVTLAKRPYPCVKPDSDKLIRMILDALTDSGLITDDALVIDERCVKTYPDSPGILDRLDRPGAVIRIEAMTWT